MKTKDLKERINFLVNITKSSSYLPIMSNILVKPKKDGLTMTSTNLDQSLTYRIKGIESEITNPFLINAKGLKDALKGIKDKEIDLKVTDKGLAIITEKGTTITVPFSNEYKVEDYPIVESQADIHKVEGRQIYRTGQEFIKGLSFCQKAQSNNDKLQPNLNLKGVNINDEAITATDGHQLSSIAWSKKLFKKSAIIPRETVNLILHIFKNVDRLIIMKNEKLIGFEAEDVFLTSKLIDGTYPDYKLWISKNRPYSFLVDSEVLADAVKIMGNLNNIIRLSLNSQVTVIATVNNKIDVPITEKGPGYKNMDIGFNKDLLLNTLSDVTGQIKVEYNDSKSAVLFKPIEQLAITRLLMPMKLAGDVR